MKQVCNIAILLANLQTSNIAILLVLLEAKSEAAILPFISNYSISPYIFCPTNKFAILLASLQTCNIASKFSVYKSFHIAKLGISLLESLWIFILQNLKKWSINEFKAVKANYFTIKPFLIEEDSG